MASSSIQKSHHFFVRPTRTGPGTAFFHDPTPLSRTTPGTACRIASCALQGVDAPPVTITTYMFSSRRAPCAPEHVICGALWQSSCRADENLLFGVGPSQVRSGDPHEGRLAGPDCGFVLHIDRNANPASSQRFRADLRFIDRPATRSRAYVSERDS
jgi:hypothetical protein